MPATIAPLAKRFPRQVIGIIAAAPALLWGPGSAEAQSISWVSWTDAGTAGSGSLWALAGSDGGLTVSATLDKPSTDGGAGINWFQSTANIADVDWPYANASVTFWQTYRTDFYSTTATFDFTNPGGLAAGGSVSILDLEVVGNSVSFTGYQWNGTSYVIAPVVWTHNSFTINPASSQAAWNPTTSTLSGQGGTVIGGIDTFAILTSNVRLDRIVLSVSLPTSDGIGIGFTQQDVAGAMVPAPSAIALLGAATCVRRRRRSE